VPLNFIKISKNINKQTGQFEKDQTKSKKAIENCLKHYHQIGHTAVATSIVETAKTLLGH
jgi:hypothetical protein